MKKIINWRLFFVLLGISEVTALMALPYVLALNPEVAKIFSPIMLIAQMIQSLILFAVAIFVGLKLGKKLGLGLPILEKSGEKLKSILGLSVGMGVLAGVLIILFSFLFSASTPLLKQEMSVAVWKSILVSFYGGIAEEVLMRLFLMTLLVWIFSKLTKGKPTANGTWMAIILSSIIFGLGHLPITGGITTITPMVIVRAIILNGIGGVIFGWLYWKKGLESAIISHFTADIVIHVIFPITMSYFV